MKTFDELKTKAPGDLIHTQDWIDLILNIEEMDTRLQQLVEETAGAIRAELRAELAVERGRIDELLTRADEMDGRISDNTAAIDELRPLRDAFRCLTLRTDKSRSSIGELVEMTAQVTDLSGNALRFEDADTRPWIDFLASWGQLKPVPGFTSRGDPGDRSIAVRVDADGIARVRVKAEHADEVSDEEEEEVSATLTTRPANQTKAISELLLEAATPMEAKNLGIFTTLSQEYDRHDSLGLRNYVDRYYVKNAPRITGRIKPIPIFRHRWRDYHSTVVAFLKDDNEPTTADSGRGFASIQVTFRDWISPWITLEYLDPDVIRPVIDVLKDRLLPKIGPGYSDTLLRFREEVSDTLKDRGVVGRYRDLGALDNAFDELQPQTQPTFYQDLVGSMQAGLKVQRTLLVSQSLSDEQDDELLFNAISETSAKSDSKSEQVRDELLEELESKVAEAETRVKSDVKNDQQQFQDTLLAEDGRVRQVERFVDTVSGQLSSLQQLNATDIQSGLSEIVGIKQRLMAVETRG